MRTTIWTLTSNNTRIRGVESLREPWSCLPFAPRATNPRLAAKRLRTLRVRAGL